MLKSLFPPALHPPLLALCALLLLVAAPLFFIGGPDWVSSSLVKHLWNFGHVVFFALLLVFIQWFKPLPHWRDWLLVTLVALVLGAGIEWIQGLVGRDASWRDLANNLCGVWLGLFWGQRANRAVWLGRCGSVLLILPASGLLLQAALAEVYLQRLWPQLNSFESSYELAQLRVNPRQVQVQAVREFATHGQQSLRVRLGTADYSGLRLALGQGDWNGYEFLAFELYNPAQESLTLVLRVSDAVHDRGENRYDDRFNRALPLNPGWNHLRIAIDDIRRAPRTRPMALNQLTQLGIFAVKLPAAREVYLDNLRLE